MAATYAALVSLLNTIVLEQTRRYHPHGQISVDDGGLIENLKNRAIFWARFLEGEKKLGAKHLEDQMTYAAYAAEDAIESYVVDQVLPTGEYGSAYLRQVLENVIREMDSICDEVKLIHQIGGDSPCAACSSTSVPPPDDKDERKTGSSTSVGCSSGDKINMVGFEDEKNRVMEELTMGDRGRTVVPIIGMGGSGKTTLAKHIYGDLEIVEHFDFRAWVRVSQEYNVREIFIAILKDLGDEEMLRNQSYETLADQVYKMLYGRRYLIVLDDIWSINAWDHVQQFFPDYYNGSRVMVTTRQSVFLSLNTSFIMMHGLDNKKSWNLLREKVFGPNGTCPPELEDVGKKISQNCRGLPISIVVIGGLLAKSKDKSYWDHIADLSSSAIHLDEEKHCSQILSLSYNDLPIFLKPCFLYMGAFSTDVSISASEVVNLWIAEGLLSPFRGQSLEQLAEEYLMCLSSANLITIYCWGPTGEKRIRIHDLLRELCLREAQKEKFLCVVTSSHTLCDPPSMDDARRIAISLNRSNEEGYSHIIDSLPSTSHPRSLVVDNCKELSRVLVSPNFKLLRVLFVIGDYNTKDARDHACLSNILFNLVNLRYLTCGVDGKFMDTLPSSIGLLGNLQTLVVNNFVSNFIDSVKVPHEIWNLPQLRHVGFDIISLLEPPVSEQEQHHAIVLKDLQTIEKLLNFRFEEGILKRISNVRELDIWYTDSYWEHDEWSVYSCHNLDRLKKLESFKCTFYPPIPDCNDLRLVFPHSIKRLSLSGCNLPWEDMTMIGQLPLLEELELRNDSFIGTGWFPEEGEFLRLRLLYMRCLKLKNWSAEKTHFPCLEHLVIYDLRELEEIPLDIGDIPTLQLIELEYCSDSLIYSAKSLLLEQREYGNEGLILKVTLGLHNNIPCIDLHDKSILVDSKRRDCYMEDVLKRATEMSGLDLEEDLEDGPDELTAKENNHEESSASKQEFGPNKDRDKRHLFSFSRCMLQMRIMTEYR